MNRAIRQLFAIWLLLGGAVSAYAQAFLTCSICQEPIKGQYHWFDSPALTEKQPVCASCAHLENVCFVCNLPVKIRYQTLEDGRFICEQDARSAVFSLDQAQQIWEETRRDLIRLFAGFGVLPGNITLSLVDQTHLNKAYNNQFSWHDKSRTLGLTTTRIKNKTEFEHTIHLLNGLNPARLAAVCAHEYAHAWLNENISRDRRLDGDTVEGFCELVAYKLMTQRNEPAEKKVILANGYTRGQINALIQAEDSFQFCRLLDWFKTGVDDRIDKVNIARVLQLQADPASGPLWYPQAPPTPVPDALTLRGISGTSNRRFALINDCTLEKNEVGKVRVGKTNVMVRCLDISAHSVVIQARGSAERVELSLRSPD